MDWNGASISALDCAGNTVLGPLTLDSFTEDGASAIVPLCFNLDQAGALLPGATVVAGGGSYDSEISWSIFADLSPLGLENLDLAGSAGEQTTCPPTTATVEFAVDVNGVDQPSADYDNVVVNGSWNGWQVEV